MEQELERLEREAYGIANTTEHFMGLAEAYLAKGETESARACLVLLCRRCSNYEESLEWHGLTEAWLKHRHLVEGLVEPSLHLYGAQPLSPRECTMQIADIFELPEDDLLSALSDHLEELSGSGDALNRLNKWERIAYYADELCREVNSGGFDRYLYYHGAHFEKAYQAMEALSATEVLQILDAVRTKFPRSRIPKTEETLQNAMDALEEKGLDFESEDDRFYTKGEKELIKCLQAYVIENKKRFR